MAEQFEGSHLFLNIPAEVAHLPKPVTDKSILLFGEIFSMLNVTSEFYMSNGELAKRLRCTKRTVTSSITQLKKIGLIETKDLFDKSGVLRGRKIMLNPHWKENARRYSKQAQGQSGNKLLPPLEADFYIPGNKLLPPLEADFYIPRNELLPPLEANFYIKEQSNRTFNRADKRENVPHTESTNSGLINQSASSEHNQAIKEIITYLNTKAKTNYKLTNRATQRYINALLDEQFTVDDFKIVIDKKVAQWLDNPKMNQYLRPQTLFGEKFESYLNEQININNNHKQPNYSDYTNTQSRDVNFFG